MKIDFNKLQSAAEAAVAACLFSETWPAFVREVHISKNTGPIEAKGEFVADVGHYLNAEPDHHKLAVTVKLEGSPFPYQGGLVRKGPRQLSDLIADSINEGFGNGDLEVGTITRTEEETIYVTSAEPYSIRAIVTLTLASPKPDLEQLLVERNKAAEGLAALDEQRVAAVAAENESYYRRKGALQRERDAKFASITQEFDKRRSELTKELAELETKVAELKVSSEQSLPNQDIPNNGTPSA